MSGPAGANGAVVAIDHRARMEILGAVLLGLFLSALDQTIVGTALPVILTDLRGNELYTWVVTIYLLAATVTGPLYGKLSDLFGRRPLLMIGIGLFLFGSALCGLAQEMWQLVVFRGIQGLGAGALFPISLAVIGDLFSPRERGRYQGLFGAVFGVAMLIGPALGGFLTDAISWHWVFYVNLPIGLVALTVIWRLLPPIRHPERVVSIDYAGALTFSAAVVPLLIGLTNAQSADWTDPSVGGLITLSLLLTGVFVWVESRAVDPLIHLELFRNRTFAASMLAAGLISFGFFGGIIFIPRWFQFVLGSSATESGYQMLPMLAGLIFSSIASGQIVARTGRYKWLMAGALLVAGVGLFLVTGLRASTDIGQLWLWMAIMGIGIGPTMAVFTIVVQNAVPFRMMGVATSALTFFRQVGGSIGLAIAGTIFGTSLTSEIPRQLTASGVPQPIVDGFSRVSDLGGSDATAVGVDLGRAILDNVPATVRPLVEPYIGQIVSAIHEAFSIAVAHAMWLGVVAAIVACAVVVVLVPELPLRHHVGEVPAEGEPGGEGRGEAEAPVAPISV
ncbi:MAG TPA: MDR family MFS transporter [candidate division Zixibacteria bacterium]|nr:MDR family MFS transporter [candidate division Zixibacteria bacterium]